MNCLKRKRGWTGKHFYRKHDRCYPGYFPLKYIIEHFGVPNFNFMSITKQRLAELAGKYVSFLTTAAHVQRFSSVAVD